MHNFYSSPKLNKKNILFKEKFQILKFFPFSSNCTICCLLAQKSTFSIFLLFIFKYMHFFLSLMTGKTTEYIAFKFLTKENLVLIQCMTSNFFSRKKAKIAVSKTISESLSEEKFVNFSKYQFDNFILFVY